MIALKRPICPNPEILAADNYKDERNKDALRQSTHGKCMYCESKIEHNSYAHVEHIKPKKKFPELEFVWDNLGYACQRCNTNKGDKYDETAPFINPYNENPTDFIMFFDYLVSPRKESVRGDYTIRALQLNRPGLIESRKERLEKIALLVKAALSGTSKQCNEMLAFLRQEAGDDREYAAAVRAMLATQGIFEGDSYEI